MKRCIIVACFAMSLFIGQSQTKKIQELKSNDAFLSDVESFLQKDTLTQTSDSIKEIIMKDRWTNTTFNPYKKLVPKYPFKITFEDSTYASPIRRNKVVTSRYGWRNGRPHRGIDIDLVTGDKVMAMFDGKVRYVKYVMGHGQTVVIRHSNGLETIYSHLSRQLVKPNQLVKRGQIIGKGGRTGNARGSHLHLVISYKGVFMNPEYFFEFNEENRIRNNEIWVTKKWSTPYMHSSKRQTKIELCTSYDDAIKSEQRRRKIYVVKIGDTLSKISHKYNVSITSLCKTNAIRRNGVLRVGQRLVVTQ